MVQAELAISLVIADSIEQTYRVLPCLIQEIYTLRKTSALGSEGASRMTTPLLYYSFVKTPPELEQQRRNVRRCIAFGIQ